MAYSDGLNIIASSGKLIWMHGEMASSQADPNLCWSRKLIIKDITLESNEHTHKTETAEL